MIRNLFVLFLCLSALLISADTPGKQPMNPSKVEIKNISRLTDYDFYWKPEYDFAQLVKGDTSLVIPSSGGAPYNATFWGVNKATKQSTDTLSFENYYAPDFLIIIDSIANNRLQYSKKEISNSNAGGVLGDNSNEPGKRSTNILLYSSISLIALILLVWYFMRRKNNTTEV